MTQAIVVRHEVATPGGLAMTASIVIARNAVTKQPRGARKLYVRHEVATPGGLAMTACSWLAMTASL